jgi:hypothetical protein
MRTNKELFELLLEYPTYFTYGICGWILSLYNYGIITEEERNEITSYVEIKRPKSYSFGIVNPYSWIPGEIKPRVVWVNNQIKILSNEKRKRTSSVNA